MGARPTTVVSEVSRIGRNRRRAASTMASSSGRASRSMSIWSMSTMALLMMMPASAISPSVPKKLSGWPSDSSASGTPGRTSGTDRSVMPTRRKLSNCAISASSITASAAGAPAPSFWRTSAAFSTSPSTLTS